jgi:hypothetical protein
MQVSTIVSKKHWNYSNDCYELVPQVDSTGASTSETIMTSKTKIIKCYLDRNVEHWHFSGVVMVAQGGKVFLNQGYGMASNDVENRPDTV